MEHCLGSVRWGSIPQCSCWIPGGRKWTIAQVSAAVSIGWVRSCDPLVAARTIGSFAPQDRDFVRPKSMPGERRVTHTTTILRICLLRMPQSPQASLPDTGRLCCPDWSGEDPQVFRHRPGMAHDLSLCRFPPCCCLLAEHGDFPGPTVNKGFSWVSSTAAARFEANLCCFRNVT
jgi:hypothetical protein